MRVSVIIPAHNEQHRLAQTLRTYGDALDRQFGASYEVLVVANGCVDGTVDVARTIADERSQIRIIEAPAPIGKGGAVLEGMRQAYGERIAFVDADGATSADSLIDIITALDSADLAIGSRHSPASRVIQRQPWSRRVLSVLFALMVRVLFGLRFEDTQCGAKAFRRGAANRLAALVQETRWIFDVDLLLTAIQCGMRIREVPVTWADQPGSRLRILATAREVSVAAVRLWVRNRRRSDAWLPNRRSMVDRSSAPESLRILALNWRCLRHPQAGGSEINLFEQARRWAAAGHQVTVVCADPGRTAAPQRTEMVEGVTVHRMGNRVTLYLHAAWFLLRHVHAYDRVLDIANGIPFFAPLFCRIPVTLQVHHVHAAQWYHEFPSPVALVGDLLERSVMPWVYRNQPVIAVSHTTRDSLLRLGFAPTQITVIHNGVNQPDDGIDRSRRSHQIAYVGRIKRYKRIDRVIRGVARLRTRFPDIRFDIAGDGDARPALEALVRELDLQDIVTIHGPVDEATKLRLLTSASVFATASFQEGWGISVLEANACGCPAVAYDVPGLRVSIRHGVTGLLAQNEEEFEGALALMLQDEIGRTRMGAAAREWARIFDWNHAAAATLALLTRGHIPEALEQSEAMFARFCAQHAYGTTGGGATALREREVGRY